MLLFSFNYFLELRRFEKKKNLKKQITKTSSVSKRKAPKQITKQIEKTVRINRRENRRSLSEAAVDKEEEEEEEEEEEVVLSSENRSSIVDGTGEDRAETEEAETAEIEAGGAMELAVRSSHFLPEAAVRSSDRDDAHLCRIWIHLRHN